MRNTLKETRHEISRNTIITLGRFTTALLEWMGDTKKSFQNIAKVLISITRRSKPSKNDIHLSRQEPFVKAAGKATLVKTGAKLRFSSDENI